MKFPFSNAENPAADQPVPARSESPDVPSDSSAEFPDELASDDASGPQFYRRAMTHFLFSFARDPDATATDES